MHGQLFVGKTALLTNPSRAKGLVPSLLTDNVKHMGCQIYISGDAAMSKPPQDAPTHYGAAGARSNCTLLGSIWWVMLYKHALYPHHLEVVPSQLT